MLNYLIALRDKVLSARKSLVAWACAAGLVATEAVPYLLPAVLESLPLAREAFSDETYRMIVRWAFIAGLLLRVYQAPRIPRSKRKSPAKSKPGAGND